jgi:hypothetical protein
VARTLNRRAKLALLVAAVVATAVAIGRPHVAEWRAERAAERGYAEALREIDLKLVDQRLASHGGVYTDDAARRWRYARVHQLLRASADSPAPRFRAKSRLLLGIYDRTSGLVDEAARAADLSFRLQLLSPEAFADPEASARSLLEIKELRRFAESYRARVEASREQTRREIAASPLGRAERAQLWTTADQAFLTLESNAKSADALLPKLAVLEECFIFLDLHRGRYDAYHDGTVVFWDLPKHQQWAELRRRLKG